MQTYFIGLHDLEYRLNITVGSMPEYGLKKSYKNPKFGP